MNKMIINTTSTDHANLYQPSRYVPIDPAYFYQPKHPVSSGYLETISYVGKTDPVVSGGIEDLMQQKKEIIHSRIQMVVSEIYQRNQIKTDNLYRICQDQCTCRNLIYLLGDVYVDKGRIELERKILDLEQEKRREKTGNFSDILFLTKELRESVLLKQEEEQKIRLFMNPLEELA